MRFFLNMNEFITPYIMTQTLNWIQEGKEEPFEDTVYMVGLAMMIPILGLLQHTIWEYFCFQMIETGHRAHTSLKTMLFRKNFKMTNATNKDFSSGEVSHIIMGESGRVWEFIWGLSDYFECPMNLIFATYVLFQQIGWYALISLCFTGLMTFKDYVRGKMD